MRNQRKFALRTAVTAIAALVLPLSLAAQQFPGFGGLEGRVGAYFPEDANTGFGFSVDAGLGYLGSPILRTRVGFNYFTADVDRQSGTTALQGSLNAVGGRIGLRVDPFGAGRLTPYLAGAITGHSVNVDADNEAQQNLLDDVYGGFLVGASAGVGLTYALDDQDRYALTGEVRRAFITDIGHWAAEVGIRITPRGRNAYLPEYEPFAVIAPVDRDADARIIAERERLRTERDRLETERLEAERLRAEREQQFDAQTAEERLRAEQEAERLRQRAGTLEAARQQEAEARIAAEQEAVEARAQADAASQAAMEAQQRAQAAEQRMYDALLNLDRLIANVTEVRETERGLAVVLGQGLFASGQATLSARARDEVGRIAAVLAQYPDRQIVVEGHTDAVGSEVTNQRLSEQRAEAVRAALIAQGVNPGRVTMVGYGESQSIAENETAAGRAQNRRVEIVVVGAQRPAGAL